MLKLLSKRPKSKRVQHLAAMKDFRKIAILSLSLFALAGCGKRPVSHDSAPQPPSVQNGGPVVQPQPASGQAPQGCSSIPDKLAIQRGIQDAMKAIYGIDEAPAKFLVMRVTPADCEHVTVLYRAQTAGATSQSAPIAVGDGGKWFVTLFNKPYPIP